MASLPTIALGGNPFCGNSDFSEDRLKCIRDTGAAAGLGTHRLEVIEPEGRDQ